MRLHVGKQTSRAIGLVDFVAMKRGAGLEGSTPSSSRGGSLLALDIVDDETLRWVGELMWRRRGRWLFAIGSQGVEYALVAHWRAEGWLPTPQDVSSASERVADRRCLGFGLAGHASQIDWAQTNGFDLIDFAAEASLDDRRWQAEIDAAVERARATLSNGRSPLVATARGPNDEAVARFRAKLAASGCDPVEINARIGGGSGRDCQASRRRDARQARRVSRAATPQASPCGALGAYALEAIAPIAPGAPLCRVFSTDPEGGWDRDCAERRADGRGGFFWIGSRRTRDNLWRNEVTKIALLGAGGKMGVRLSTNLKDTRFDVDHVEVSEEGRARLKKTLGIECMEQGQAVSSADAVVMAVPDRLIGKILKTFVNDLRSGREGRHA